VKREAAGLPLSQSVSKAMLLVLLAETQAHVCGLGREIATLKSENSPLRTGLDAFFVVRSRPELKVQRKCCSRRARWC
jgi:hypothetical protein